MAEQPELVEKIHYCLAMAQLHTNTNQSQNGLNINNEKGASRLELLAPASGLSSYLAARGIWA